MVKIRSAYGCHQSWWRLKNLRTYCSLARLTPVSCNVSELNNTCAACGRIYWFPPGFDLKRDQAVYVTPGGDDSRLVSYHPIASSSVHATV